MYKVNIQDIMIKVLESKELDDKEYGVYCALITYYDPKLGYSNISKELLADYLNVGGKEAKRKNLTPLNNKIKALIDKGFILVEEKIFGNVTRTCYYFTHIEKLKQQQEQAVLNIFVKNDSDDQQFTEDGFPLFDIE